MRDIRHDLLERLQSVDAEIAIREQELADLESERGSIVSLLEFESKRQVGPLEEGVVDSRFERPPSVRDVVDELLGNGEPWSTVVMAQAAIKRGCEFEGSKPGRAVHGILLGMLKSGHVESVGEGRWRMTQRALEK